MFTLLNLAGSGARYARSRYNKKGMAGLVPLGLAALAVWYFFFKKPSGHVDAPEDRDFLKSGAIVGGSSGSKLGKKKALDIADKLEKAMDQFGTDEDHMAELLRPLSPAQYAEVYDAFGLRAYSLDGRASTATQWAGLDSKLTLSEWIREELSEGDEAYDLAKGFSSSLGLPF